MKLDAIAEAHAYHLVYDCPDLGLLEVSTTKSLYEQFFGKESQKQKPMAVMEDAFWDDVRRVYVAAFRSHHERMKDRNICHGTMGDARFEEIIELASKRITMAQQIVRREANALLRGRYSTAYVEGDDRWPLTGMAQEIGMEIVWIDDGLGEYAEFTALYLAHRLMREFLQPGEKNPVETKIEERQRMREDRWAEKIASRNAERAVMVVGAEHVQDKFGLCGKLFERDIEMVMVEDLKDIGSECALLTNEIRKIMLGYIPRTE